MLAIFVVEIALKMAVPGRQPWHYFREGCNVFDFTIVALGCLPMNAQFAAVLRLARALRLLRLVTALPRLQLPVGALLKSLGAMGYVGLLLALLFHIYGVAGIHLFREAVVGHFGSLKTALLSLFHVVLPGPGVLVIAAGVAILATELVWAHRVWRKAKGTVARARRKSGLRDWLRRTRRRVNASRAGTELGGGRPTN